MVRQAVHNGDRAIAITDYMSMAGVIPMQVAARAAGIHAVVGAEVLVEGAPLVLLAKNQTGFATINRLISKGFEAQTHNQPSKEALGISLEQFAEDYQEVFVLTGGHDGRLWSLLKSWQSQRALDWVKALASIAGKNLYIEISSHRREGDSRMILSLLGVAQSLQVQAVATNNALYATAQDAVRYDALTLSRLRLTVNDDHPERPSNAEGWLKPRALLEDLIHAPRLYDNAVAIAEQCQVDLIAKRIQVPRARLKLEPNPNLELEALVRAGIKRRYPLAQRKSAVEIMPKELAVIAEFELAEFFLVVNAVVQAARALGIRTAGRGSAASSIVVYALGIAHADPLKFRLRFERFLNPGRFSAGREAPDIDIGGH